MHILILGACCSCNLGDALICRCVEAQLRQAFPQAEITLGDPVQRDRLAPKAVPAEGMLRRRAVFAQGRRTLAKLGIDWITAREEARVAANLAHLEALCAGDYDVAVFAGGQLFMDGYALLLEACVELLGKRRIPVIFHAMGLGPLSTEAIRSRLTAILQRDNVKAISTREPSSIPGAVQVSDPALCAGELLGIQRQVGHGVGLGIQYPVGVPYGRALRLWRGLIRELDRRAEPWQLFTNGDPADEVFARRVLAAFPGRENAVAPRPVEPETLLKTVAGYRAIVSYRLHSHISAVSLGIPTAAVVWDEKVRCFFQGIGCPERCFDVLADPKTILDGLTGEYDRARLREQWDAGRAWLVEAVKREAGL